MLVFDWVDIDFDCYMCIMLHLHVGWVESDSADAWANGCFYGWILLVRRVCNSGYSFQMSQVFTIIYVSAFSFYKSIEPILVS